MSNLGNSLFDHLTYILLNANQSLFVEFFRLDCAVLAYYEPRAESLLAQERSRLELEKLDKTRKRENIRPYIVGPTVQRRGRIVEQLPPERLNGGNEEKADDPKTAVEAEEDQEAAAEAGQANDDPNLVAGDEPLTVRSRMQVERSGGKNVYKVKRIGK